MAMRACWLARAKPSSKVRGPRAAVVGPKGSSAPVGIDASSSVKRRIAGSESRHCDLGISGMPRYGWNPKLTGSGEVSLATTIVSVEARRHLDAVREREHGQQLRR